VGVTRFEWPYARVFAHRCGGRLAPENTLRALDAAAGWCGGVEFDVMLSGSGSPVLIHDETLERTTNGRGRVADTSDQVLRTLDAGAWFGPAFAGERLPTLAEAGRRCVALGLDANVEIKPSSGQDELTGQIVAREVRLLWANASRPPLLSSFSEAALHSAAELAPELPRGLLVEEIPRDWLRRCRALGAVALHADTRFLDQRKVRAVVDAGLWLVGYTENGPARARSLFGWGVNCLITDRPDRIAAPN
jgi:glycerophosphoryl diester phosphodiesterase